ncbi:F-box/kelch-repeat protein-like protein [Tanacetum coccineum]
MSYHLCEDLIAEIFSSLPPKSLIRFRSLNKSWFSRIGSQGFIRTNALRSTKYPHKVIVRQQYRCAKLGVGVTYTLDPDNSYMGLKSIKFRSSDFCIVGSCNGILCVIDKKVWDYSKNKQLSLDLWNLSIRRKLSVPVNPRFPFGGAALGFGFDPITDDYKIVSIPIKPSKGYANDSFLYTLKTNSWNEITSFLPTKFSYLKVKSSALFVNGTLHWLVEYRIDKHHILTFNLSTHMFDKIRLPQPGCAIIQLTIIKGSLAVISNDGNDTIIWVRNECNNVASWSEPLILPSLRVEGENILNEDFEGYNPETGVRSRLVSCLDSSYIIEMDMCVESLELLDKET